MKKIIFSILIGGLSCSVHAGGISSGGGATIICKNAKGSITSAEMLDLFEGKLRFNYSIPNDKISTAATQFTKAVNKIQNSFLKTKINELAYHIVDQMQYLPAGIMMSAPNDLGVDYMPLVPQGCELGAVGYYETDGTLRVSQTVYDKLSKTDRAAFILHEAIYALLRQTAQEKDSSHARKIVAQLISSGLSKEATAALELYSYPMTGTETLKKFAIIDSENFNVDLSLNYIYHQNSNLIFRVYTSITNHEYVYDLKTVNYAMNEMMSFDRHVDAILLSAFTSNRTVLSQVTISVLNQTILNDTFKIGSNDNIWIFIARTKPTVNIK